MFKNIFKWFLIIHVVLAAWVFFISLLCIDSQGGGQTAYSHRFSIHLIGTVVFLFLLITPIIHIVHYINCTILKVKKRSVNFKFITISYVIGLVCLFLWSIISNKLGSNGEYDLIWGPADSGLVFLSFSSFIMHYLLLSNLIFDRVVLVVEMFYELIVEFSWSISILLIFTLIIFWGNNKSRKVDAVIKPKDNINYIADAFHFEQEVDSNASLMLPYCRPLLNEKFYQLLGDANLVSKQQLKSAFKNTATEELVIGVFVGGGKRKLETNLHRGSSDESVYEERFYPDFYYYAFQNYMNMFMMINPDVPQKVFNYKVDGDELIASYSYNDTGKVAKQLRLKPTNDSLLINNVYCKIWIKNGSQRFIDISFLTDSIKTDNFNINHQYFQEVLERFVQLKCGKRDEMYTTDYEIVL